MTSLAKVPYRQNRFEHYKWPTRIYCKEGASFFKFSQSVVSFVADITELYSIFVKGRNNSSAIEI